MGESTNGSPGAGGGVGGMWGSVCARAPFGSPCGCLRRLALNWEGEGENEKAIRHGESITGSPGVRGMGWVGWGGGKHVRLCTFEIPCGWVRRKGKIEEDYEKANKAAWVRAPAVHRG